ncbi:MAG: TlpA disulfide reductase family protein [Brumimicrobium sp.]
MLKQLIFITSLLIPFTGFSQEKTSLKFKGQIFNAEGKELQLFQQNTNDAGNSVLNLDLDNEGEFEVDLKDIVKDYYYLKVGTQVLPIIIKDEAEISVFGDGKNLLYNSNVINSDASTKMIEFLRINNVYKYKEDSAQKHLEANPQNQRAIQQAFTPIFQTYQQQRETFIKQNLNSPALFAVISTLNFENDFETFQMIVGNLEKSFGASPTIQKLSSEFNAAKEQYRKNDPLAYGNIPPEIELPNPDGKIMKLSDYRGKVVLLDFWAAWCGPCRRENPNVVNLYKQYHDQGFDVFSVSLDRTKEQWLKAIEQDGLVWEGHVSDLKYWQSEPAKEYGVRSIPFTILLDREGKIIGKNLRGQQLADTLRSIFE